MSKRITTPWYIAAWVVYNSTAAINYSFQPQTTNQNTEQDVTFDRRFVHFKSKNFAVFYDVRQYSDCHD